MMPSRGKASSGATSSGWMPSMAMPTTARVLNIGNRARAVQLCLFCGMAMRDDATRAVEVPTG